MPTPAGKPKVGERIRWRQIGGDWYPWYSGTVLERTSGTLWSLKIQPEDENLKEFWLLTAQYYLDRKCLEVIED